MKKSTIWRTAFLGATAIVVGMEIKAAVDGDKKTDPWTDMIVRHVPGEVTALAVSGLSGWLAVHFGVRYIEKAKEDVIYRIAPKEGNA